MSQSPTKRTPTGLDMLSNVASREITTITRDISSPAKKQRTASKNDDLQGTNEESDNQNPAGLKDPTDTDDEDEDVHYDMWVHTPAEPHDTTLKTTIQKLNDVSLVSLRKEERKNDIVERDEKIQLQLVKCVAPPKNKATDTVHFKKKNSKKGSKPSKQSTEYERLFLCRVHSATEGHKLVWIMQTEEKNNKLFKLNYDLRDDGTFHVGCFFTLLNPSAIDSEMKNRVPLLYTNDYIVMCKSPSILPDIPIDNQLAENRSKAFISNYVSLKVGRLSVDSGPCSGNLCAKTFPENWTSGKRGCGCFGMCNRQSSLVITFDLKLETGESSKAPLKLLINNFSNTNFLNLFLSGPLPVDTPESAFGLLSPLRSEFLECVRKIVEYVYFFTITGYVTRGEMDDKTLVSEEDYKENVKVGSGHLTYHVVDIRPTNNDYITKGTHLYNDLKKLQFDVDKLAMVN